VNYKDRLQDILQRIELASKKSVLGKQAVELVAVSKAHSLTAVRELVGLGLNQFGENYVQELIAKAPLSQDLPIRWRFIGNLQSNKVKHLLPFVSSIDSVDSVELARKIARVREQLQPQRPPIPILLQVNVGSERQKSGLPPQVMEDLFDNFVSEPGVLVGGLMTLPPFYKDLEKLRPHFQTMRALFLRLKERHPQPDKFKTLSMGMSRDFEMAIEEGANCIRIGEALFGPRPSVEKK
jgi:pyridoxal phosphate enzyme (YggS family)